MNLGCVYGLSKQLGKRPRPKLDYSPQFSAPSEASLQASAAYRNSNLEGSQTVNRAPNSRFDPVLDLNVTDPQNLGITPPQEIQLPLPPTSMVWPPVDIELWGDRHRCYHEANEVIQLLSLPERVFQDDAPIILDISDILQATSRAIRSLKRLVDCDCTKHRGHQAMLYASLISRALWWYREASDDEVYRASEATGMPSPNTPSENSVSSILAPQSICTKLLHFMRKDGRALHEGQLLIQSRVNRHHHPAFPKTTINV